MYRIESKIVERLKKKDLNATALLQEHANVRKHKIKKMEEEILRITEKLNERIRILADTGMTTVEIIQLLEDGGMVVERIEND